jgi:twinkle protein
MLAELLLDHGIRPRRYADGDQKLVCPRCSHTRKHRSDPCLSLTIARNEAIWKCHHCEWSGAVNERENHRQPRRRPVAPIKPTARPGNPTPALLRWFSERGISAATVQRNQIWAVRNYVLALGAEVDCIAFPYFRVGELVNIKFRALAEKAFAQVKDAEKILYGLDDIAEAKSAIIVEGELDKLALEEAGISNVVSVPDGAPKEVKAGDPDPDDAKFSYVAGCAEDLNRLERIVLATDNDGPGLALAEELARRLGKERCWRVRWPDSGDVQCKDANDVLLMHGADVLRECIDRAEPYPIAGLHSIFDFADETLLLYRDGRQRGLLTGWKSLDEYMTIRPGELSVATGVPGSGKSEFIDSLTVNLAQNYGWRFALCSFENPPAEHIAKLAEKHLGAPFWDGPTSRMSEVDLGRAMDWIADRFYLIRFDDEAPTIEAILEKARRGDAPRYPRAGHRPLQRDRAPAPGQHDRDRIRLAAPRQS